MPEKRRLSTVIDDMLKVIPSQEVNFISSLESVRNELKYAAPEIEGRYFQSVMNTMYENLGPIDELNEDWKKEVTIIFMVPNYLLEFLKKKWATENNLTHYI